MARNTLVVLLVAVALGQGLLIARLARGGADSPAIFVTVAPPSREVAGLLRAAGARVGLVGDLQPHNMSRVYSKVLQERGIIVADGSADVVAQALLGSVASGSVVLDAHRRERLQELARQARAARDEVRAHQAKAAACEGEILALKERVPKAQPGAASPGGVDAWRRLADLLGCSP